MGQDKGFVAIALILGVVGVLCEQLAAHDLISSVYCMDLIGGDVRRLSSQGADLGPRLPPVSLQGYH